jgi:hypothetical protein
MSKTLKSRVFGALALVLAAGVAGGMRLRTGSG